MYLYIKKEEGLVSFLQDLVRIPSINGIDSEGDVAMRIVQEANAIRGLSCQLYAKETDRPNVVITLNLPLPSSMTNSSIQEEKEEEEENDLIFLLVAHSDTVPIGDSTRWRHQPLSGCVVEEKILYGRGACDNKAGIAVGLYTLKRLVATLSQMKPNKTRRGKIVLAVVVDEEIGANSPLGLRHLLDLGVIKKPSFASSSSSPSVAGGSIYTYPGRSVTIGHRGVLRFKIEVRFRHCTQLFLFFLRQSSNLHHPI